MVYDLSASVIVSFLADSFDAVFAYASTPVVAGRTTPDTGTIRVAVRTAAAIL